MEFSLPKIFLLSNLYIYSYMIKLITSDHLKMQVCLFMCQTSLGHCRSKDSKPRSSPAERLFYQRQRLCPNTQNTFALPLQVQVVLINNISGQIFSTDRTCTSFMASCFPQTSFGVLSLLAASKCSRAT
uniref:Uncharacterized protein n=1 Tax=Catharus ustulatus TaxID=91951 RepID=A0A8C3U6Y5_CATUS